MTTGGIIALSLAGVALAGGAYYLATRSSGVPAPAPHVGTATTYPQNTSTQGANAAAVITAAGTALPGVLNALGDLFGGH